MFATSLVALAALTVQIIQPSQHAVVIRTADDAVIVSVDVEAAPRAACRFLEALIASGDGGEVQPIDDSYTEIRSADGARIGVYRNGEPALSGEVMVRTGEWIDPAEVALAEPAERAPAVAFEGLSLMGPNPAQCGW